MRVVALVAILGACDDDSGDGLTVDNIDEAVASAFCDIYVRCGVIDDHATCLAIFGNNLGLGGDLEAAVDAGKVIFDAGKGRECLNSFGNATCDLRVGVFSNRTQPLACDETFRGTVGAGGQCALNEECISHDCDVPACPDACCQGTCVGDAPPARVGIGSPCTSTLQCINSYCDLAGTSTCTAFVPDNAPCMSSASCESGACSQMICRATVPVGGACSPTAPCRDLGTFCHPTTMLCTASGLTGDPCTIEQECSAYYTCTGTACALGARLGEACSQVNSCIDQTYCDATTMLCTAPKPDGAACMNDNECQGDICDPTTNACMTPPICI
jgi:hypothetical protein